MTPHFDDVICIPQGQADATDPLSRLVRFKTFAPHPRVRARLN